MRAAALLVLTGCLRSTAYHCATDADCGAGACHASGYCAFDDPACESGRRFGEYSGPLAGQCVADDPPVDAFLGACAATYAPVPGAGAHVYRVIAAQASWVTQRDACATDGYLVIPDDRAELTAIMALAAAPEVWVGISDAVIENVFRTVKNTVPPFLPWDVGEPNDQPGNADCVRAKSLDKLADDQCGDQHPAVCECDP